jgi:predicted nucleotidyltransferase
MRSCSAVERGALPPTMEPSFEKLLVRLAEAGVQFIVVGGVAVTLHGYVRLTEDVDILIAHSSENVARLLATLAGYGEGFARELTADDFQDEEGAIRIVEESEQSQLDVFTRMSGLHFEDLIAEADTFQLGASIIRYASKAALIRLKSASPRAKDRLDVDALRQLLKDPHAFD